MQNLLVLITLLVSNSLQSQNNVAFKDIYVDNDLVYRISGDQLFSGFAQKIRKNGHLVYEEKYIDGIIQFSKLYYNGKEKRVSDKVIYNVNWPFTISKEYRYNLEGEIYQVKTYNNEGLKILEEEFINGNLSYSCGYFGKKKHGLEIGYLDGGNILTYKCEFINGKKHGKEYCLNEDGTETTRKYSQGKRLKE